MKKLLITSAISIISLSTGALADALPPQRDTIKIGSQQDDTLFQNDMHQKFQDIFNSFFTHAFTDPTNNNGFLPIRPVGGGVMARSDMYETKDNVVISVDIPGAKKEDIDLQIVPGAVSIKYTQKVEKEQKDKSDKNYIVSERSFGSFERQYSLPDYAEVDKAEAEYKDGVLTITIPKNEKAIVKPKKLEIK